MTELISATTVFIMAYAIHVVFQSVRLPHKTKPASMPIPVVTRPVRVAMAVVSEPVVHPVAEESTTQTPPRRATTAPARPSADRGASVRDPVSGDITTMPTNYRFAKKWIKEALVAEGLLDKVYKPNELDDTANQKTRNALERFKSLPKYQP
ncbi:MAG: hypothetical protein ACR2HF_03815 [Methylococcaceae bacterium]